MKSLFDIFGQQQKSKGKPKETGKNQQRQDKFESEIEKGMSIYFPDEAANCSMQSNQLNDSKMSYVTRQSESHYPRQTPPSSNMNQSMQSSNRPMASSSHVEDQPVVKMLRP